MKQQTKWREVLATQFALLGSSGRHHHLQVGIISVGLALVSAINAKIPVLHMSANPDGGTVVAFEWFAAPDFGLVDAPGLLGFVIAYMGASITAVSRALGIWSDEGPLRRGYHWSLPVTRFHHDLTRVAAGAISLTSSVALLYAGAVVGLLVSGRIGTIASMSFVGWLAAFGCPLVIYLIASIAPVMSDRPGRRLVTALLLMLGPLVLFALIGFDAGFNFLNKLYGGAFSHSALLTDGFFPNFLPAENRPEFGRWLIVVTMWILLSGTAVTVAAWKTKSR